MEAKGSAQGYVKCLKSPDSNEAVRFQFWYSQSPHYNTQNSLQVFRELTEQKPYSDSMKLYITIEEILYP